MWRPTVLVKQWRWYPGTGWSDPTIPISGCHLVLAFGTRPRLEDPDLQHILEVLRGTAPLVGCASVDRADSGGTIGQGLIVTALRFERSGVQVAIGMPDSADHFANGQHIASQLDAPDLRHLFVFTESPRDGGSEVIRGIRSRLVGGEAIPGGMVCAGTSFETSWVLVNDTVAPGSALAIGLSGRDVQSGDAKMDGWMSFGPSHHVSAAHDSVLRELEGADGA
ncbi:MAG: hypothetical protein IPK85_26725 [Gemmatimonadetes bacterium]|nr:hypothetical protein [Gemmatimonadota bacterium]